MARDRSQDPDDIDALLAEVDRTLHAGTPSAAKQPARRAERAASSGRSSIANRLSNATSTALIAGAAAAVVIGVLFALLPFVAVWSGAIGAFCGAFGVGFVYGLRSR